MPDAGSAALNGLRGRCPRCGRTPLFAGFLSLKPSCEACGLDFNFADSADGPAVFIMFIVGFLVIGSALAIEFAYQPPIWMQLVGWSIATIVLALGLSRPMKGLMIGLQYGNRAEEGRLDR